MFVIILIAPNAIAATYVKIQSTATTEVIFDVLLEKPMALPYSGDYPNIYIYIFGLSCYNSTMILREPSLRPGWYPKQRELIEEFLEPVVKDRKNPEGVFSAAVVAPHAGWYYSGLTAALAVSSLDPSAETIAVIGGHLPRGMPILVAGEEGVKTPLGIMEIDRELLGKFTSGEFSNEIGKQMNYKPDNYQDNTVEVLLPMVHYLFPHAKLLWLRFPADIASFDAGRLLAKTAAALGRRLVVAASTDLTHYGSNYGFAPKGFGKPALDWVKVNDAAFINAVLQGEPSLVLERAGNDQSACSAGAVVGALGFASTLGKTANKASGARLLEYRTSADVSGDEIPPSFVGYAAISLV